MNKKFDATDLMILRHLQENCRISNSELARRIGLSQPATHARLKQLEASGVIRQHTSHIDREQLGFDIVCFIQVQLRAYSETALTRFQQSIEALPNVQACYQVSGNFDYLLKVVLASRRELEHFLRTHLIPIQEINQLNTSIVISEIKETTALPLPNPETA